MREQSTQAVTGQQDQRYANRGDDPLGGAAGRDAAMDERPVGSVHVQLGAQGRAIDELSQLVSRLATALIPVLAPVNEVQPSSNGKVGTSVPSRIADRVDAHTARIGMLTAGLHGLLERLEV